MKSRSPMIFALCVSISFAGCLFFSLFFSGCGSQPKGPIESRKINVVATTGMIGDIVSIVGGERVAVTGLMGPGVDPHTYQSSAKDERAMEHADVIFYNGLHLEGKMGEVFSRMGKSVKTVAVTDGLDPKTDLRAAPEGFEGTHDPHVWFDVTLWMKAVQKVEASLSEMDPTHAALYRENASKYLVQLKELDDYVKQQAARVPSSQRILITAHDAFYYFGRAYGFEVHGLQGVSTATEASLDDVDKLAALIVEKQVPAIFVESSVPLKNVQAIQEAVAAKKAGFKVRVVKEEPLFSDALGERGTPQGTYVGMVRHNIDTIVGALGGK